MRLIETGGFSGSVRNRVVIVFDGQEGIAWPAKTSSVKVVFSTNETADDLIRRLVGKEGNKKNVYAVTDDNALRQSVKDLGAKVLGVKEFLGSTSVKTGAGAKVKRGTEEKNISSVTEFKINDELRKIWL